jgi:hypothetical protein
MSTSKWISSFRAKYLIDLAVRNAERLGYAPPDITTIEPPPTDDRCDCCQEIQEPSQGPKRRRVEVLELDHDHFTGAFRGWLCSNCNRGIGLLRDTEDGVQKALDYLTKENWWVLKYRTSAEQKAWYLENRESLTFRETQLLDMAARNAKRLGYAPPDRATFQQQVEGAPCDCCLRQPKSGNGPKRRLVELYFDYDHETGAFRGWLCNSCNRGIGLLRDTVSGVQMALDYLRREYPWQFAPDNMRRQA